MSDSIFWFIRSLLIICIVGMICVGAVIAQTSAEFYKQGVEKMEEGECEAAIKLFTKAIVSKPNHAKALMSRGQCYLQANDHEKALADLNAAIKFNAKLDEAFKSRGDLYSMIGKFREAIADHTQMLRLVPDDHDTLMARAAAYREIGDTRRAEADERKADKVWKSIVDDSMTVTGTMDASAPIIRPKLLTEEELTKSYIRDMKGGAEFISGTPEQRREVANDEIAKLNSVIKINPGFAAAYFERANNHVVLGDQQNAIADYSKAIDLDPNLYKAFNNRAVACARTGNYERAIADLARAMTYEPKDQSRHYNFGLVLFNQAKYRVSVNILTGYLERNTNDFKAYQLRALAYRKLNKTAEADADEAAARRIAEGK